MLTGASHDALANLAYPAAQTESRYKAEESSCWICEYFKDIFASPLVLYTTIIIINDTC